jgi:hypothetical protein
MILNVRRQEIERVEATARLLVAPSTCV